MTSVFIALGANLGDRYATFDKALLLISERVGRVESCSSYYENAALNPPGATTSQPDYLNAVCKVESSYAPLKILEILHLIENELGLDRSKKTFWGPREIDLDIISFGDEVLNLPDLKIPHPRMKDRDFVLKPLKEIAPEWKHPISGESVDALLEGPL